MVRAVPIIRAFNGGELTPLLLGRNDQDKYHNGCKTLLNMIPLAQGPAARRGGTRYTGAVKTAANRTWLATFRFSLYQNYILEFGDFYIRFWANRGQLLSGGVPYEVVTPYAIADLTTTSGTFALRFAQQSGDVLYIAHSGGLYAPRKLSRLGATNWTLTTVPFSDGPFQSVDPSNTITMQVSAATGAVTVTASANVFDPTDVGTSLYLESQDASLARAWSSGVSWAPTSLWANNGNVYSVVSGTNAGVSPPVHVRGSASDGGEVLQYLHSCYGVVQITGYTDAKHVTGTVLTAWKTGAQPIQLPDEMTAAGFGGSTTTKRWALSQFSAKRGWPVDAKFYASRLAYVGANWLACSQSGIYDSFALKDGPDALETCGILLQLPTESLTWIGAAQSLVLGTPSGERSVQEQSTAKAFAADNLREKPETNFGAAPIEAMALPTSLLFVQRTQQRLREMTFDFYKQRYSSEDITVLSEHIFKPGVTGIAYAQEPDGLIWCALGDGTLASCTYNRDRGVLAWARHALGGGGFVEAIAAIPSPDGKRDDLWLIVRRVINGSTVRYVEFMEDRRLYETGLANAVFADCAITYSGAPTVTIAGLNHLEGQTVDLLLDGSAASQALVSGGVITLSRSCSKAQIGVNARGVVQPMPIDPEGPDGTGQTRFKAVALVYVRFVDTVGGSAGPSLDALDSFSQLDFGLPLGVAPALFTGDVPLVWDAGFATDAPIFIVQDQPLPMTVAAIVPRVETND